MCNYVMLGYCGGNWFFGLLVFGCWFVVCILSIINDMLFEVFRKLLLNKEKYCCVIFCLIVIVIYSKRFVYLKFGKIFWVLKVIWYLRKKYY